VSELKTQTGTRLGTPKYMSPEQVAGRTVDHRSDIFSLGIVLYEMLTGTHLFHGSDVAQVMHNITSFDPPPPSRVNGEVPPLLDLVVKRALEKKPRARYQSAWEMAADLRNCLQELAPAGAAPAAKHERDAEEPSAPRAKVDKTAILKPAPDDALRTRRMPVELEPEYRLAVSRRFDSAPGLARLTTPAGRDLHRLTRAPHPPGLLRRLWHERDLMRFAATLTLGALLAVLIALS